jgi:hypothetical protein
MGRSGASPIKVTWPVVTYHSIDELGGSASNVYSPRFQITYTFDRQYRCVERDHDPSIPDRTSRMELPLPLSEVSDR